MESYVERIPISYRPFAEPLNIGSIKNGSKIRLRDSRSPDLLESIQNDNDGDKNKEFHEMRKTKDEWDTILIG